MDSTVVVVPDQIGNRLANCTEDRADALIQKSHAEAVSSSPPVIGLKRKAGNGVPSTFPSAVTRSPNKRVARVRTLRSRDGNGCFYCRRIMESGDLTLEHLLSIKDGGTSNLANLVLSHRRCNEIAGDLPIIAKIRLRENLMSRQGEVIDAGQSQAQNIHWFSQSETAIPSIPQG
jgi:hypothetical protein